MSVTIESLELEIQSNAGSASRSIDKLMLTLSKLKSTIDEIDFYNASENLRSLNSTLQSLGDTPEISRLTENLGKLKDLNKIRISTDIATELSRIENVSKSLNNADFTGIREVSSTLSPLSLIKGARGLNSLMNALSRLPEAQQNLEKLDIAKLEADVRRLSNALTPLAIRLNSIARFRSFFPVNLTRAFTQAERLSYRANRDLYFAYKRFVYGGFETLFLKHMLGWIRESNDYIEHLNLFRASLGKFSEEAKQYAETVQNSLGIDAGEWMKHNGVFMTLIKGFGVTEDKANIMSKNLTQLGYDISSFFNISFAESMQKLTSGISGELEPLRRLGYDLSQARLKAVAAELGIKKHITLMTQAEKSQLRYYAIMTQVTHVQGDMARTISSPANQMRVLNAHITMLKRSFGNILIPTLVKVLPYVIAVTKVVRLLADSFARLNGFVLPEFDYSELDKGKQIMGDIVDEIDNARGSLKKLENAVIGIDELNIISEKDRSGLGNLTDAIGGDLGIKLPEYDFLKDANNSHIDAIVEKIKEWAGMTGSIDEYVKGITKNFGKLKEYATGIVLAVAGLKFSKSITDILSGGTVTGSTLGINPFALTLSGLVLSFTGIKVVKDNLMKPINESLLPIGGGTIALTIGSIALAKALKVFKPFSTLSTGGLAFQIAGVIVGIEVLQSAIDDVTKNGVTTTNAVQSIVGGAIAGGFTAKIIAATLTAFGITVAAPTAIIGAIIGAVGAFMGVSLIDYAKSNKADKFRERNTTSNFSEGDRGLGSLNHSNKIIKESLTKTDWSGTFAGVFSNAMSQVPGMKAHDLSEKTKGGYLKRKEYEHAILSHYSELQKKYSKIESADRQKQSHSTNALNIEIQTDKYVKGNSEFREKLIAEVAEIKKGIGSFTTFEKMLDHLSGIRTHFREISAEIRAKFTVMANPRPISNTSVVLPKPSVPVRVVPKIDSKKFGRDTSKGFSQGIKQGTSGVKRSTGNLADVVTGTLKGKLGIKSPSRLMRQYGIFTVEGFNDGIMRQVPESQKTVNDWIGKISEIDTQINADMLMKSHRGSNISNNLTRDDSFVYNRDDRDENVGEMIKEFIPILKEIRQDMKRQADKKEQTTLRVSGRDLASVIEEQQRIDGYSFTG